MKVRVYTRSSGREISGGLKQMYRLVDVLCILGYDAALAMPSIAQRQNWFKNDTNIVDADKMSLEKGDVLVIGEQVREIPDLKGVSDAFIVVYAQNPYGVIPGMGQTVLHSLARYRDRIGMVMCVSEHSRGLLSWMLRTEVVRVRYSFDREPFGYHAQKSNTIAIMPRKSGMEISASLMLMRALNKMRNWHVGIIGGRNEEQTAEMLKRSAIFMSGSNLEGFGMPPAEAMACGCVVVGYDGIAGEEFMDPSLCLLVRDGDMLGMAMALDKAMSMSPEERMVMGAAASGAIRSAYSTEREIESVKQAFKRVEELI